MGERESPERPGVKEGREAGPLKPKPAVFNLKNISILIVGVVLSSFFAIFTVGNYIAPAVEQRKVVQQSQASAKEADTDLERLTFYRIDPLIVNPADSNGERYLKATISLEAYDPELLKEIEKRLPQIKNQINNVLSSKTIEQIQTSEAREKLRREIQNRVNGLLLTGRISNVYFEEFVYQ